MIMFTLIELKVYTRSYVVSHEFYILINKISVITKCVKPKTTECFKVNRISEMDPYRFHRLLDVPLTKTNN